MSNEIGGYKFPRKHAKSSYIEEVIKNNAEKGSGNMSEVKRHYIADESLGGIEREYVEVERKADTGDKIVIVNAQTTTTMYGYKNGDIYDVLRRYTGSVEITKPTPDRKDLLRFWDDEYKTLSATDIIRHNGQRYEMVDRKAEVGDKVLVSYIKTSFLGTVGVVNKVHSDGDISIYIDGRSMYYPFFFREEYSVLLPLDDDSAQSPQSTDDIIANLVARLAKAERKITELSEQVDHNTDNIRTWAEDYSEHKADISDKVEMLTEDIAMLDERTQPLTTEGVSKLSEELAQVVTEAIDIDKSVFNASNIRTFNLSDLNGKTLKIRTSTDWDGNVYVTTTVGFDENEDKIYILENKTEVFE